MTEQEFKTLLNTPENTHLEFKEASNRFNEKDINDYCAAISNTAGGHLVLGVNDNRKIIGTKAFLDTHSNLSHRIYQSINLNVTVEELFIDEKRVLLFCIPPHRLGIPTKSNGRYTYPIRRGSSICEMSPEELHHIFSEKEEDFSSQYLPDLTIENMDLQAIENYKNLWSQRSGNDDYRAFSVEKLLTALRLKDKKGIKLAALILFGKKEILEEYLPAAEIIFEWRKDSAQIEYDFRKSWREPFFKIVDELWETINARNENISFQDGFFINEIPLFAERPIREAILNAVAHRDYTISGGSIIIKASPESFIIQSPGGFPPGITEQNILFTQKSRNRTIAETLAYSGLVERSGQGMDVIFSFSIRHGKGKPDLSKTSEKQVVLSIPAQIKDKNFIFFLKEIQKQLQVNLSVEEVLELENIRLSKTFVNDTYKKKLLDLGVIEYIGKHHKQEFILSKKYYAHIGKLGEYSRLKGFSRSYKKEIILKHIEEHGKGTTKEFVEAIRDTDKKTIENMLQELRRDKKIISKGTGYNAYWVINLSESK